METVADNVKSSMTTMELTATPRTTVTIALTSKTKTTMQLYGTTVANLVTLQESAGTMQPTSVVVLFGAEIGVADFSLGLQQVRWQRINTAINTGNCLTKTVQQIWLGIYPSQKTDVRNHTKKK